MLPFFQRGEPGTAQVAAQLANSLLTSSPVWLTQFTKLQPCALLRIRCHEDDPLASPCRLRIQTRTPNSVPDVWHDKAAESVHDDPSAEARAVSGGSDQAAHWVFSTADYIGIGQIDRQTHTQNSKRQVYHSSTKSLHQCHRFCFRGVSSPNFFLATTSFNLFSLLNLSLCFLRPFNS
jgi:hypothetical protein